MKRKRGREVRKGEETKRWREERDRDGFREEKEGGMEEMKKEKGKRLVKGVNAWL